MKASSILVGFMAIALRVISVALMFLLVFGSATPSLALEPDPLSAYHQIIYNKAIVDAAVLEQSEVSDRLTPIKEPRATVVTWTGYQGYKIGQNTLAKDIFVTVVPEVKQKCENYPANNLTLRLEQLIGLPPNSRKTQFVEMSVNASDIVRPCANPDITTTTCGESVPKVSKEMCSTHEAWLAKQMLNSYQIPKGFPFTRLGYTYDWNPNTPEFGVSEYVIHQGAEVKVTAITPTATYCSPQK